MTHGARNPALAHARKARRREQWSKQNEADLQDSIQEDEGKTKTRGAGAIAPTAWGSNTLINYDQVNARSKDARNKARVTPAFEKMGVLHDGRKVIVLRVFENDDWPLVWDDKNCYSCGIQYADAPRPDWVVAHDIQRCPICMSPRGREAIVKSPVTYGPVSDVIAAGNIAKEQVKNESGLTGFQAANGGRLPQLGHPPRC